MDDFGFVNAPDAKGGRKPAEVCLQCDIRHRRKAGPDRCLMTLAEATEAGYTGIPPKGCFDGYITAQTDNAKTLVAQLILGIKPEWME